MSSPAVLSVFIWPHPYKSLSASKVKTKLLLQYPCLGKYLVSTTNYMDKLEIRVMKHLVSNQAKCLWLLDTGPSAKSQPRAPSSLHPFPGSTEYVYFLKWHVWAVLMWHWCLKRLKKKLQLKFSVLCSCFCAALGRMSSSRKGGWKQLSLHFLSVFYTVSTPVSHLYLYTFP